MSDITEDVSPTGAPDSGKLTAAFTADSTPPPDIIPSKKSRRRSAWLAMLALLVALAALAVTYFLWRESAAAQSALSENLAQLQTTLDTAQATARDATKTLNDQLDATSQAASSMQTQLDTMKNQQLELRDALQALHAQRRRTETPQALAEAESLLRIANHSLLLERDVTTALASLTAADSRLQETRDPAVTGIRQTLADEITVLRAVQQPDITGAAQTLGSLMNQIEQMPLVSEAAVALPEGQTAPEVVAWREFLSNIWSQLKGLVVVRQSATAARPLIAPGESYFLYQNLRLELQTARLALLRQDATVYRDSLDQASTWLNKYFKIEALAVQSALTTLADLEKIDIHPDLPAISRSLQQLQELMTADSPTPPPNTDPDPLATPSESDTPLPAQPDSSSTL